VSAKTPCLLIPSVSYIPGSNLLTVTPLAATAFEIATE